MKAFNNIQQIHTTLTGIPARDRHMLALPVLSINEWSICNYDFYRPGEYI